MFKIVHNVVGKVDVCFCSWCRAAQAARFAHFWAEHDAERGNTGRPAMTPITR